MASTETPAARAPGRLNQALLRLLMKRATIAAIEDLAPDFRLITLEGPALRDVAWIPGQKAQIAMGSAFVTRTYTPMDWDAGRGRSRLLGFMHGDGPGAAWVRGLAPGAACDVFGPRRSLDVGAVAGPLAVFGDETSIGLGHALSRQDESRRVSCHFEVGDVEACRAVAAHLGLGDARLFARTAGDGHLAGMEAALPALAATGAAFVLTGKAGTIQRLRRALKRHAVPAARISTKAYWAPGKTGLD
ncbi:siderophore-interacting protein [Zavarzinia compransoris]|uniref:siderophore-interacting protein n=1 Tax=Zavarzinia marina TaxID=2911065 RepID=UPI001F229A71|nr:siderophore-interacting protein [Zavarzinia marina]MCF4166094.1 siderophore-interacting protein [Zavarzinia marina]